ncbi:translocation protein TolB [Streptomyces globosus]|uniref:translocation protein TolB n=1 Tax=Streptomyces globosus TaxID=68209 RepID=UPI003818535D
MKRRVFLRAAAIGAAAAGAGAVLAAGTAHAASAVQPGPGPYGELLPPDANGLRLPAGFTSRVVARAGQAVPGTAYTWHTAPGPGGVVPDGTGWIYVSHSEHGGASALRFSSGGTVTGAHRVDTGSTAPTLGTAMPGGGWLVGERVTGGYAYEADPRGVKAPVRRPEQGRFKRGGLTYDGAGTLLMTEDEPDGGVYQMFNATLYAWTSPAGTSQIRTARVPDPSAAATPVRRQLADQVRFDRPGTPAAANTVSYYVPTRGDSRIHRVDTYFAAMRTHYDPAATGGGPLTQPREAAFPLGKSAAEELFVTEGAGGNAEVCAITGRDTIAPFLRLDGAPGLAGLDFAPNGKRMYVASPDAVYEVSGPFNG